MLIVINSAGPKTRSKNKRCMCVYMCVHGEYAHARAYMWVHNSAHMYGYYIACMGMCMCVMYYMHVCGMCMMCVCVCCVRTWRHMCVLCVTCVCGVCIICGCCVHT